MIMKGWSRNMDFEKEDLKTIPIWIQLKLGIKSYGENCLYKIVSQLGKPMQCDDATRKRDKVRGFY